MIQYKSNKVKIVSLASKLQYEKIFVSIHALYIEITTPYDSKFMIQS